MWMFCVKVSSILCSVLICVCCFFVVLCLELGFVFCVVCRFMVLSCNSLCMLDMSCVILLLKCLVSLCLGLFRCGVSMNSVVVCIVDGLMFSVCMIVVVFVEWLVSSLFDDRCVLLVCLCMNVSMLLNDGVVMGEVEMDLVIVWFVGIWLLLDNV